MTVVQNEPTPSDRAHAAACPSCGRDLAGRVRYWIRGTTAWLPKCARCSLLDAGLLRRSAKVAFLVGSLLVALNQGGALLSGTFPWASAWYNIPLTYLVPYGVATYGALANGYQAPEPEPAKPNPQ